jgi:tellurite resistance protein TerC
MTPPSTPAPRRPRRVPGRDLATALGCVALGLGYGLLVWHERGPERAQQYLAGYLVEFALSIDNVFVFVLVFSRFGLDPRRQRRVLLAGVLGAIALRTTFLFYGIGAIARFAWLIPAFGFLILATAVRLACFSRAREGGRQPGWLFRLAQDHLPAGLAALVVIEAADFVFALDSLPAVLAVTRDPGIAIASNVLAVLGLRSLFSVVSGALRSLRFLNLGLAAVLAFVGAKMLAERWYAVPTGVSLLVIAGLLGLAAAASLLRRRPAG